MNKITTLTLKQQKLLLLTQFVVLVGIAIIAPFFNQQIITGSIVNATLFISVILLGVQNAVLIALIPSLIALSVGFLPPTLIPMIPFIVVGNIILVMTFNCLKQRNFWLGIISASILKFVFLFSTSSRIINLFLKREITPNIAVMMSWPQLFTAVAGGLIAYIFSKNIKLKI